MGLMDRDYYKDKIKEIEENKGNKKKYFIIAILIALVILILFLN